MRYTRFFLSCRLDAVAHGGNHGSRSWGEPPRPRCLPKTALHRSCLLPLASCLLPLASCLLPLAYSLFPVPCSLSPYLPTRAKNFLLGYPTWCIGVIVQLPGSLKSEV
ncbi:hypothetical protein [Moorena sp. SIO3B2]|uniref:hypothetical protein n=1 Tax=Moorena sp. SIO3B2 TaxID=2607827 RepID=UPI0013C7E3B3|nr:hypothetical protein [Moorena sp. SIO3B2]NEP37460.1 hypothetical protein [Moorena sp. SIO3B2]